MSDVWTRFGRGVGFKILLIMAMSGLMAFFLMLQEDLVNERRGLRDDAVAQTISEWGGRQKLSGPFLRVPYREILANREVRESFAYVLPDQFEVDASLRGEKRQRGIYEVPLYVADLSVKGDLVMPQLSRWLPVKATVDWDKTEVCFFLGSAQGLAQSLQLLWGGKPLDVNRAVLGDRASGMDGFSVPIPLPALGEKTAFQITLQLKGGESFEVFPAGLDSRIRVHSDQGAPTFGGGFLPLTRHLTEKGFDAEWQIPALARQVPPVGTSTDWNSLLEAQQFAGFELGIDFDSYRLINRALKYALLFILVPFVGLFLYEIFTRRRVHPVQYLLVGFAVVMFYILVLSLSERMEFAWAFVAGAAAVCALLGVYCASILNGGWQGLWCFSGMAGLYGLLYLIISSEDNALLVGSFFLFFLLTLVMVATRRVDWYALGRSGDSGGQA